MPQTKVSGMWLYLAFTFFGFHDFLLDQVEEIHIVKEKLGNSDVVAQSQQVVIPDDGGRFDVIFDVPLSCYEKQNILLNLKHSLIVE